MKSINIFLNPLVHVALLALYLYKMGLIIYGIIYVLEMFDIYYRHHPLIYKVHNLLFSLYDPFLSFFGNRFPIQISIVILYLILELVTGIINGLVQ